MAIDLLHARRIFDDPEPPAGVSEKQFDGFDDELKKLAGTEWREIREEDLWYYVSDLAFVELQQDLFDYLFPICLDFWAKTLMEDRVAPGGAVEFHDSILQGDVLEKMIAPARRQLVYDFFHDGLIERISRQAGFKETWSRLRQPSCYWVYRFNSMGYVAPIIGRVWDTWWNMDHPGKARAALLYGSALIWEKLDPCLTECDAEIYHRAWLPENVDALSKRLTPHLFQNGLQRAADALKNTPEYEIACGIAEDAHQPGDVLEIRIDDLIEYFRTS